MELLCYASGIANAAALMMLAVVLHSPDNRRRLACWLLATAQALEEIRAAKRGINDSRREIQHDMERRWCRRERSGEVVRRAMEG